MKKMSKRLLAVVLCVVMLLGVAVYTVAAQGREATIVFDAATGTFTINNVAITYGEDGKQQGTYPDLFPEMKGLMPGDSVQQTIKVKVKNAGADTVKLMLKAEDVTAEPDRNPTNDDYDKLVSYKTESGEGVTLSVKFDGQSYSGELTKLVADAAADQTQGVYLGAYTGKDSEKELTVDLSIPLTAGNELQGLTAQLGWVITAEVIPYSGGDGGGGGGGGGDKPVLDVTNHFAYIIGRKDGNIHPWAQITRGEVATIYFRMLTDEARNKYWSTSNPYPDVAPNTWCNNAISTMTNAGVVQGYKDGLFRQNAPITRGEFAAMAARFFDVEYSGPDKFSDIDDHWAKDYINKAAEAGIILGYKDGTFQPERYISRAEAILIFNRVLERHPDKDHLLDDMITWPDNMDPDEFFYADVQEATNSHDYEMKKDPRGETYEVWTKLQPVRDWAAFENEWATANAASNPGNVYSSSKSTVN